MKIVVTDSNFGNIEYEENIWTNKKSLKINGKPLTKVNKNVFSQINNDVQQNFVINGNIFIGEALTCEGHVINLIPKSL